MIIKHDDFKIEDHYTGPHKTFYVSTSYFPNNSFTLMIDKKVIGYPHNSIIELEKGETLEYGIHFRVKRSDD